MHTFRLHCMCGQVGVCVCVSVLWLLYYGTNEYILWLEILKMLHYVYVCKQILCIRMNVFKKNTILIFDITK